MVKYKERGHTKNTVIRIRWTFYSNSNVTIRNSVCESIAQDKHILPNITIAHLYLKIHNNAFKRFLHLAYHKRKIKYDEKSRFQKVNLNYSHEISLESKSCAINTLREYIRNMDPRLQHWECLNNIDSIHEQCHIFP